MFNANCLFFTHENYHLRVIELRLNRTAINYPREYVYLTNLSMTLKLKMCSAFVSTLNCIFLDPDAVPVNNTENKLHVYIKSLINKYVFDAHLLAVHIRLNKLLVRSISLYL